MLWTRLALAFHSELLLFEADLNSLLRWVCTGVAQRVPRVTSSTRKHRLRLVRPLCSPERETETLTIGFSDMMCDVGNAAIKDAIANIARNREVLHFLSCIARFLGHFSGLATIRPSGLLDSTELTVTNPAKLPHKKISGREVHFTRASQPPLRRHP